MKCFFGEIRRNSRNKLRAISPKKMFGSKELLHFFSTSGYQKFGEEESYSFGFQKVTEQIKKKMVDNLFSDVANKYDLMNDLMSLRLHRCWKEEFVKELDTVLRYHTFYMLEMMNKYSNNKYTNTYTHSNHKSEEDEINNNISGMEKEKEEVEVEEEEEKKKEKEEKTKRRNFYCKYKILDLAGGTGDIALKILEKINFYLSKYNVYMLNKDSLEECYPEIIVCDPNRDMLNEGKKKAEKLNFHNIIWLNEHSENLKSIENNSIDIVTVSFGIRNFTDLPKSLNEIYRVLKPGGRFLCLEFMNLKNCDYLDVFYKFYLNNVIPFLGTIIANNRDAYKYLSESIQVFLTPQELSNIIYQANFRNVHYTNLTCGIVAIHSAYKIK